MPSQPVSSGSSSVAAASRWRRPRLWRLLAVGWASFTLATTALADEPSEALKRAREQFRQAISLQTAGNWAGALKLFREVSQVRNTPQVRFNIAICEENLGKLVQALGDYKIAAEQARQEGAGAVGAEVEQRLTSLEERIPKLTVTLGSGAKRATIMVDGVELGNTMVGTEMPLDTGYHVVEAEARGFAPFEHSFEVEEGGKISVEVVLEPEGEGKAPGGTGGAEASASADVMADGSQKPGMDLLPFIVGGAGVASLAASGVFYAMKSGVESDMEAQCDGTVCPDTPEVRDMASSGQTYTLLSNITLGLGVVGVTVGGVLLFTGGSGDGADSASQMRVVVGGPRTPLGARFVGRF